MKLSVLVVTKAEPHAIVFLAEMNRVAALVGAEHVIVADGSVALDVVRATTWLKMPTTTMVNSRGYIESVLDQAVAACSGDYILRLDDDERCSESMIRWLAAESYLINDHWKFPRAHLWKSRDQVLLTPQLWPDHQTRLSVRAKAGGRNYIHSGSPFGGGLEAPVAIEHHKFIVKNADERWDIAKRYDSIAEGSGTGGMVAFQVPEHAYWDAAEVWFAPLGDGNPLRINMEAKRREGGLA